MRRVRSAWRLAAVVVLCLAWPGYRGHAQPATGAGAITENVSVAAVFYEVRKGDTLDSVAAGVYGDRKYAPFVAVANGIGSRRALVPGERLTILVDRELVVSVGDTFASLAAVHLGSALRAGFLAKANELEQGADLVAGAAVRVPLQASLTAQGGETLSELALRFYGDAAGAALLRSYNARSQDVLRAGEVILIPGLEMRVRPAYAPALDEEARRRLAHRETMAALVKKSLPSARAAWRDGNMAQVKRDLVALDLDYLALPNALEVALLLGGSYVASEDADSASAVFRRIISRAPGAVISAYHYPPKICAVWRDAGGMVRDQP